MRYPKIIGGFFDISLDNLNHHEVTSIENYFHLQKERYLLLDSGRSAFSFIIDQIDFSDKDILLPDYICWESMQNVLEKKNVRYSFYPVSNDLVLDPKSLCKYIDKSTKAILLTNYFGLYNQQDAIDYLKSNMPEVLIIIDSVQSPYYIASLKPDEQKEDYLFTSLRKSFPIPDGAIVRTKHDVNKINALSGNGCDKAFSTLLISGLLKNQYLSDPKSSQNMEDIYLRYYRDSEIALKSKETVDQMYQLSYEILCHIDFEEIKEIRRRNYLYLADSLRECNIIKFIKDRLDAADVPLFAPVMVRDGLRDPLRKYLQSKDIYCPVHWPIVDRGSLNLSKETLMRLDSSMSLVIDQRYDEESLKKMVDAIYKFEREFRK